MARKTEARPAIPLRERQKRERRRRIVEAARELFREKGYEAATTREIAARAEVGAGTLFAYASDKRKLLLLVFREQLRELTDRSFAALPPHLPVLEQLIFVLRARYEFWGADFALARHAVRETFASQYGSQDGAADAPTEDPQFSLQARLTELVKRNQEAGAIAASEDPALVAQLVVDIYLSEHRDWIARGVPSVDDGIERLRPVLALALRSTLVAEGSIALDRLRATAMSLEPEELVELERFAEFCRFRRHNGRRSSLS
jgi:AcrR family transcriptional regulator